MEDQAGYTCIGSQSMRTTIDIDDELIREAQRLTGITTKKAL